MKNYIFHTSSSSLKLINCNNTKQQELFPSINILYLFDFFLNIFFFRFQFYFDVIIFKKIEGTSHFTDFQLIFIIYDNKLQMFGNLWNI